MKSSMFFRLLNTSVETKDDVLADQVSALNAGNNTYDIYLMNTAELSTIPGSPFAYWIPTSIRNLFKEHPRAEGPNAAIRLGLKTNDDFRFLRLAWEVNPQEKQKAWVGHVKGGAYSPYYYDVHLLLDWARNGENLREHSVLRGESPSRNIRSEEHYFRCGLTWPRRSQKGLSVRAMPDGCIFADKGPAIFVPNNESSSLLALLAVTNSLTFKMLVRLQMAFGSYEVGVIQRTAIPANLNNTSTLLAPLAQEAHDLIRQRDLNDETTHAFYIPGLISSWTGSLPVTDNALNAAEQERQDRLANIQDEIDEIVFNLYGLSEEDRALIVREIGQPIASSEEVTDSEEDQEDEEAPVSEDLPLRVQSLLMWCVGAGFGRWDIRKALDPSLLPELGGPFDPLPRCAPGALIGPEGLPATPDEVDDYPLPISWDGILVDDPSNRAFDIVERVRDVLTLIWQDQAADLERDILALLGLDTLREYFRNPRGFFDFHIKRYSKSRRKAPIYWLLQSEKRNYGIWLYLHRLCSDTLYVAAREYADAKVSLEQTRIIDLRQHVESFSGAERKHREREIDLQDKLIGEVTEFRDKLDKIALLNLPPDLNDGVVLSIAPLYPLVPWKEAEKYWIELTKGKHAWSTMASQMRAKGLVKG